MTQAQNKHIPILDGWRALSILFVLAGHWLPIGPKSWEMNAAVAASGMALFFCLSGFLITQFLSADPRIGAFLIKRMFRIIPLAWLAMIVLAVANGANFDIILANVLFFANLPPSELMRGGEHLWSLCVEMQFYIFMAGLVLVGGRKALFLIPFFTVCVTLFRVYSGETISIVTWHRVDEIFIGGCVALIWNNTKISHFLHRISSAVSPVLLIALVIVSSPQAGELGYFRPYIAGAAILSSLYAFPMLLHRLWTSRIARYIAQISYALYVFHVMLTATALGGHDASKFEKYALRIPLAVLTWCISHLSTFHYERAANTFGRKLAASVGGARPRKS